MRVTAARARSGSDMPMSVVGTNSAANTVSATSDGEGSSGTT